MGKIQPSKPTTPAGKVPQLKAAAQALPKDGKVSSKSTQKCPPPKKDWSCVRYHKLKGPKYTNKKNQQPMSSYRNWHSLIDSGKITEEEAKLMLLMSPNEGDFNGVQAYDNQAITAGAMQKTVNKYGQGELPDQVNNFKKNNPAKYKELFEDKGWSVVKVDGKNDKGKLTGGKVSGMQYSYTDKEGKPVVISGEKLYGFIKGYCNSTTSADAEKALDSMRQAMEDDAFKEQQILGFKKRIKEAIGTVPKGYDHPISDYMSSAKGRALALDQSVNKPAYVEKDYGKALDDFYKQNPKASKNPADWGDKRSEYEDEINEFYGMKRQGTDMPGRYQRIKEAPDPVIPDDVRPIQNIIPPLLRPTEPSVPKPTNPFSWLKF